MVILNCNLSHTHMRSKLLILQVLSCTFLTLVSCSAQPEKSQNSLKDRMPAVSGSFYPNSDPELTEMIVNSFLNTKKIREEQPLAIIVPHAGYVFSGHVAAAGYKQIDRDSNFDRIFLIGSSHTMYFSGAAIYDQGDFLLPYGKVKVDTLAAWLIREYKIFNSDPRPHQKEHCIEVQLPFLQYWLRNDFTIVPIIIGGDSKETSRKIAEALKPFFNERNLFIISSDFSHYPKYTDAQRCDKDLAAAIKANSAEYFLKTKSNIESSSVTNLATAMCGWTSVYTLLKLTEDREDIDYYNILYQNSGDTPYGDKDRVVGYYTIGVYETESGTSKNSYDLSDEDKVRLLKIARKTISQYIPHKQQEKIAVKDLPASLTSPAGAFVTLKHEENLRGCIGHFEADNPLYLIVQKMAIAAATEDPRFYPVRQQEIDDLEIEISVLTPMRKIDDINEIDMGKHGIYIKRGSKAGTFLPQVATETGWKREEFLGHCSRDKAGIGWDGWKTAEIYIYEALVFSEHEFNL